MTWKKEKLKPLGWFRSAGVNKKIDTNQKEVNLINYMDVYRNHQISSKITFQKVTAKNTELENANVVLGDVLFTPSSEKPTDIGHAGVVMENLKDTVYSYHLVRFRPYNPSFFNPLFFSYLLNTYQTEKHFVTRATGTTRYTLSLSDFKSLEIEYPENPKEQTAIATILSKVDEAIEAVRQSIKTAEKLKKALMQNLLTGKLKPDGTWRTEDEFYEDEKFGKVPVGWEVSKVKRIVKLKNGKGNTTSNLRSNPDNEYNIPVFGGNGITGYFHTPLINKSTLIIGRVGEYCGNVFLTPDLSWVTDNAMLVDKFLIDDYSLKFFKLKFNRLNFKHYSDTTGQPKITQGSIGSISFYYPIDVEEQIQIADKINFVENNIKQKQTKIQTLQRLKKSLMQNLLTGKVLVDVEAINKIISEQ